MKRTFNIFDGLFLLALYFKLSGTGPALAWWEVFAPYIVEAFSVVVAFVLNLFNLKDRLKFWFWKMGMKLRVRRAANKASAFMKAAEERGKEAARKTGGNPGQFVDPANKGQ